MSKENREDLIDFVVEGDDELESSEIQNGSVGGERAEKASTTDSLSATDSIEHANDTPADEVHDDDSHDDDDDPIEHEDDDERAAIRERRRQERQERKQRAREREDSYRREIAAQNEVISRLTQQVNDIQRRNTGGDLARIADAKRQVAAVYEESRNAIADATNKGDGKTVAEATERMVQARERYNELDRIEKNFQNTANRPQPLDQRMVSMAQDWTNRNKWYDANGKDQDSRIVLAIDQNLADEGYDPTSKRYWDELDARVKKYLPHRANRVNIAPKARTVVSGSSRGSSSASSDASSGGAFKLSKQRADAIKAMGKWDDPVERNRLIKQYRDYDRANKGA